MSRCKTYSIVATDCPCLLQLQDAHGNIVAINLEGATVRPIDADGNFNIQSPTGGALVASDSSFTESDIETLICNCHASGGSSGSSVTVQVHRELLVGVGSFTMPADTKTISYSVIASSNPNVTPTITTNSGTDPLLADESGGYDANGGTLLAPLSFTTSAGDQLLIIYTK